MSTPVGQRFSHVYLERGTPASDSPRFRRRLSSKFEELADGWQVENAFAETLVVELGVALKKLTANYYDAKEFFLSGELRDVLDAITLFYRFLAEREGSVRVNSQWIETTTLWHSFVERVMREENVGYRIDSACGVHYFVDGEFERNRAASMAALGSASLANARAAYEDAFRHLDSVPRDTKASVRSMFETAEILAKQICPGAKNLNRWLAENTLRDKCIEVSSDDSTEKAALAGMFASFGQWVDAVHLYRHGQTGHEPVAPSEELAVHVLSTGSAYVRLLATAHLRLLGQ